MNDVFGSDPTPLMRLISRDNITFRRKLANTKKPEYLEIEHLKRGQDVCVCTRDEGLLAKSVSKSLLFTTQKLLRTGKFVRKAPCKHIVVTGPSSGLWTASSRCLAQMEPTCASSEGDGSVQSDVEWSGMPSACSPPPYY
ncbi:unnamed protein product [Mesocestoides corti]|uniref:TH1 domain-containing protein n=1 Tax=Mesocestoides corti TaxID=53468 RepID=A0A0R3UAM7_MESCO|nr:unnamed protein product [Mesocestoides corti]